MGIGILNSPGLVISVFLLTKHDKMDPAPKKLILIKNTIDSFKFNQAQRISHLNIN